MCILLVIKNADLNRNAYLHHILVIKFIMSGHISMVRSLPRFQMQIEFRINTYTIVFVEF